MPRWVWFVPVAALALALGIWAFRLGWIAATLTETDVITAYSALYLEERGADARLTDCTAQPGPIPDVWILVTCVAQDTTRYDYPVNRFGRLIKVYPETDRATRPKT